MRRLPPILVALIAFAVQAVANGPYKDQRLDALLLRMKPLATDSALLLIDQELLAANDRTDPRTLYFLHRYRCEQLYYQGLFQESMIDAERARRLAESLGDSLLIASSFNQIAVLLEEKGDNGKAIIMLRGALRWFPHNAATNYPLAQPHRIHNNLGQCLANLGRLDSARAHMERSYLLAKEVGSTRGQALAVLELGNLWMQASVPDSALAMFDRARSIAEAGAIVDVSLQVRTEIADALHRAGRTAEALAMVQDNERFVREHPDIAQRTVVTFRKRTARLLAAAGHWSEALAAAREWNMLDSALRAQEAVTMRETLRSISATDAALVVAREEQRLARAEMVAEEQRRIIVLGSGVLLLALLAGGIVFHIARGRQKDLITAMEIERVEQEKRVAELRVRKQVSEDLHDDLGAGLSALKLHCELAADTDADPAIRQGNATQAALAGDLVSGMRHILWSLNNQQASLEALVIYTTDRVRAFAGEHDLVVRINADGPWAGVMPDAEMRRNAWYILRDVLRVLVDAGDRHPIDVDLAWNDALVIDVRCRDLSEPAPRAVLAKALATHQTRISAMGGSVRSSTHDHFWMTASMPIGVSREQGTATASAIVRAITLPFLTLALLPPASAQTPALYRHPLLDSVMHNVTGTKNTDANLRVIDHAIASLPSPHDARLESQLLMTRANQLYYRGLFDMGIINTTKALALAQGSGDSLLIATAYNMIGLLHENLGDPSATLPWFRKAEEWIRRDTRSNYPVVKDYHIEGNIAQCLFDLHQRDTAAVYFERSLSHALQADNLRAAALAELGLGRVDLARNDAAGALVRLDTASAYATRHGSADVVLNIIPHRARAMAILAGEEAAMNVLREAIRIINIDSGITPGSRRNFLRQASALFEQYGSEQDAVQTLLQWQQLDSAIRATDDRSALGTLKIMLDNEQHLQVDRAERERSAVELGIAKEERRALLVLFGAVALLLAGVVVVYTSRRRNAQLIAKLELARSITEGELAELQVRQRVSEEMHEDLGAGLAALKLRSDMALATEQDEHRRTQLQQRSAQAGELIGSMRQIIWALDSGHSTVQETMAYIAGYASTYSAQQGLRLDLSMDAAWPEAQLSMEQRRNLFLVVKEAMHNTVKHAQASAIELRMMWHDGIAISVADNGRGMPEGGGRSDGNGSRNMRKRIEAIGGTFSMEGEGGVRIDLFLPLNIANKSSVLLHGA